MRMLQYFCCFFWADKYADMHFSAGQFDPLSRKHHLQFQFWGKLGFGKSLSLVLWVSQGMFIWDPAGLSRSTSPATLDLPVRSPRWMVENCQGKHTDALWLWSSSDHGWAIFYNHRMRQGNCGTSVFFCVSLSLSLSLFIDSCHNKAVSGLVWPCLSLSCPGWDWNLFPHRIDSDCSSGTCYVGCSMKYHDIYLIGFPTGGLWHQGHWSWSWKYHRSFQKSWACTCACFAAWLEWGT